MKFGIFNQDTGNAVAWFDSEDAALEAISRVLRAEPEAIGELGLVEFDEHGHPQRVRQGDELSAGAVPA